MTLNNLREQYKAMVDIGESPGTPALPLFWINERIISSRGACLKCSFDYEPSWREIAGK